jgi:hypothetical protein
MKDCPKCGVKHERTGTFCSRKCANSRVWSEESKKKRGESLRRFIDENPHWAANLKTSMPQRIRTLKVTCAKIRAARLQNGSLKGVQSIKIAIIERDGDFCSVCYTPSTWNDRPLVLQLDHINGVNTDNRSTNVRLLCPNCHSQTETYGGSHPKAKEALATARKRKGPKVLR